MIGATTSMKRPTGSRRSRRNSLPSVSARARSAAARPLTLFSAAMGSVFASCGWSDRIAQRVASERDERVLEILPMEMQFNDAAAELAGERDYFRNALVETLHGERGPRRTIGYDLKFADACERTRPSRGHRNARHQLNPALHAGQGDELPHRSFGDD